MAAFLLNAVFAQHQDAVGVLDGRQAVRNGQRRAANGQLVQTLPDKDLTLIVQGAGCFVQQQNTRVLQKYPCNGNALLLPAAQLDAALAHIGVVAAFQRAHKLVGTR